MWILPLAAAAVSGAFCITLTRAAFFRPRPQLIAWAIALGSFAAASAVAALGMVAGWTASSYRTYYLLGAIINVPVLAAGTVYLLTPRRAGHLFAGLVGVAAVISAYLVFTTQIASAPLA
ncbi:MAG: hypothetical protein M3345_05540, partial [Actinomycetota bacterium]|nr:hypothetical protein [Actinomycetota bacterium]